MGVQAVYRRFAALGAASAGGSPVDLSVSRAGELLLPTGRVIAADVFFYDTVPFTRWLPAGRFPVHVLHAGGAGLGDRIAAAMIRVAPGEPVRWEAALTPGQNVARLGPDEFFGYGVDSGTGSFESAEAFEFLAAGGATIGDAYAKLVQARMFPSRNEIHVVADIPVGDSAGLNVVAFASGWGDGGYESYFGVDAGGKPLVLVTNFAILDGEG